VSAANALTALALAKAVSRNYSAVLERIPSLPRLAMRMELFDGINGNTIINDTYNLDLDAFTHSLDYQLRIAGDRKRIVIVGLDDDNAFRREEVIEAIKAYAPDCFVVLKKDEVFHETFTNAVILIKGTRQADMQRLAKQFRLKNHKTFVEIDLSVVRENVMQYKSLLRPDTKILAMVKAQSYGSGVEKIAAFLDQQGINALGVAYADEGVELRKQGITLPIMVMNAEEDGFDDCIQYCLEPAVYSFRQLDLFIRALIDQGCSDHPIHVKIDTGMKRLGFELNEVERLCQVLNAQPEVRVKSVYSHLADSDNRRDKRFTEHQIKQFHQASQQLARHLNYHFDRHILNSEGVANFPEAQFEMVRLGIGMYGITGNTTFAKKLQPAIRWYSAISQIKHIQKGESVGYSRSFIAEAPTTIAVIPVGYADGYRRSLGNGKGGVYIHETFCPTVGRVCMDMIMVDVTKLHVKEGDKVEIIGRRQSIGQFAAAMDTIPYEVMTSISKRVHRVYLD
jgi:alanine racemase